MLHNWKQRCSIFKTGMVRATYIVSQPLEIFLMNTKELLCLVGIVIAYLIAGALDSGYLLP
jgi:hypothetical protein